MGACRPAREGLCELGRLRQELTVRQHPVDDVPSLERGRVVERARHHELARSRGAGTFGDALRAAPSRSQADHGFDQAELG